MLNIFNIIGYLTVAPNGFVNGVEGEMEENEDDAYPENGPLPSGAQSLKRVPNSRSPLVSRSITIRLCEYVLTQ